MVETAIVGRAAVVICVNLGSWELTPPLTAALETSSDLPTWFDNDETGASNVLGKRVSGFICFDSSDAEARKGVLSAGCC
jgi:hypothetical protein